MNGSRAYSLEPTILASHGATRSTGSVRDFVWVFEKIRDNQFGRVVIHLLERKTMKSAVSRMKESFICVTLRGSLEGRTVWAMSPCTMQSFTIARLSACPLARIHLRLS